MSTTGTPDPTAPAPSDPSRGLAWLLLAAGLVGLVASAALLVERIVLAGDPSYVPSCSFNPVLSCGSVMVSEQAALLGFPNPVIGVAAFPVVVATGAGLLAGARYARWYWLGLLAGVTLAAVFVGWLVFQSLYRIGALCPYCMVVWAAVLPLSWYVLRHCLESGVLGERVAAGAVTRNLRDYSFVVPALVVILVAGLALARFWDYWVTVL